MALNIEKTIDLTSYAGNSNPKIVNQLSLIHEAKEGELVQYYIDQTSKIEGDKNTYAIGIYDGKAKEYTYVNYDEVIWNKPKKRITSQKIDRLVLKAFPNVGAIASYKLAYHNISRIIVPVNYRPTKYEAPTLKAVINADNTITFTFTPPKNITYQCYRVILSMGIRQLEYVSYETTLTIPQVLCTGTYDIYCIGYVNEGEITSFESNIITLSLIGMYSEWPKVSPGAETYSKAEIDALTYSTAEIDALTKIKIDTELNPSSQNPVTNAAIYAVLGDVEKTMQNIIGGE